VTAPLPIEVVRATVEDAERLAPMFDAYRRFYGRVSAVDECRGFLRERLERSESVIYIAQSGDGDDIRTAGFVQLYPSFSSVSLCRAWTLNDLFVDAAHRRLGAGRALMERAIGHCRETGAGQLWLQTDHTNATAQRLYDAVGMTRHEVLEYTLAV